MRMLVLTWRRGLPLCIVIALSLPVTYVGRWDQWLGIWSETQNYVGIALIFGIPAAAAAGAWVGAHNGRSGVHALQEGASISATRVAVRELGELVVWVAAGFALACAPAYLATALTADVGHPRLLPIISQLACLAGSAAVGHGVGTRVPWYMGAPVCAAVAYVLLGFLSFNADSVLLSLTPIDERWMTFHRILWWVLSLQALMWVLVLTASIFRRGSLPRAQLGCLILAGLAAAPLLYVTPATRTVSTPSTQMGCTTRGTTTICIPLAKSALRDNLTTQADRAQEVLHGLLSSDAAFIDDEARGVSYSADRSIDFVAAEQSRQGHELVFFSRAGDLSSKTRVDTNQFHYSLIAALAPASPGDFKPPAPGETPVLPAATPTDVIHRWYLTTLGVPIDGSGGVGAPLLDGRFLDYNQHASDVEAFEGMDAPQRARWFAANAASLSDGTLGWSSFETIGR